MFITIKDAWKAEKTAHAEKEECIPSVFLLIFGHKRFKHTLNSAEPGLKRNIIHRQNKTHKFSDYPLLNFLCIRHLCCCCSFFIQTQTQRHRKTDESKAIWKNCWPQSRFQATVYMPRFLCHELFLPLSFGLVYVDFWLCLFRLFDQRREWRQWHVIDDDGQMSNHSFSQRTKRCCNRRTCSVHSMPMHFERTTAAATCRPDF